MARRQFKDLCVLVVDDEEFIRSLVTRILTALEITDIEEASDGAEAIEKALAKTPDVVICDIEMEPVNGLEFLKRIRTAAAGLPRALPVIYLTGAQDGAIIGNAFALDPSAFVKKPSDLETLRDRIDRATGGHQAVQPPHAYEGVPTSAASPVRSVAAAEGDTRSEEPTLRNLEDVRPGAILADDVTTKNGQLLLVSGLELGESHLRKLADLSEMMEIGDLWVWE